MQQTVWHMCVSTLESCAGRVNPRGLWVPAFAGTRTALRAGAVRVRVELAAGTGRTRDEKFFVRVTKC